MTPKLCEKYKHLLYNNNNNNNNNSNKNHDICENKTNFIKIGEFKNYYKICDLIGKGSFGCVYSGIRSVDSKTVAIKHIDKNRVIDWRFIESIDHKIPTEIYFMEKLNDIPGIIKLYEWFETEHSFLIIMERPHNSIDLFELKKLKPNYVFSEFEVKLIFKQLLETLDNCLKEGVIHRDVKPENILINTDNYSIKLIDFGAGGYPCDRAIEEQFKGTIQYCPPEYLNHKCDYSEQQMVWSLGVLLYELICGEMPFESEDQILNNKTVLNFKKNISKDFKNIIQKCLARNPKKRPSISKLAENQLFNYSSCKTNCKN